MKSNINLNDPRVQWGRTYICSRMEKALAVTHRLEEAVFPIYWTLRSSRPEQIGSGVAIQLKDQYFIFSASHVFDDIGKFQLLINTGSGNPLTPLAGDRFSSAKGQSGKHIDDPIDASVFHIQSNVPSELKTASLSLDDLDFSQDNEHSVYIAAGFRSKQSKTTGNIANAHRECFPSIAYAEKEYSMLGVNIKTHIALAYEDQVLVQGKWQTSPRPQGISGGAIIRVAGVSVSPLFSCSSSPNPLLTAITIAQRREKSGKPGVLIGTRIGIHLGLIHQYLPDVLDVK